MCDTTTVRGVRCVDFPSHTLLSLFLAPDDHLRHCPTPPLDTCPSRAALTTICTTCTTTRVRRALSARAAPAAAVPYRRCCAHHREAHHDYLQPIPPSRLGACAWAHLRPNVHYHQHYHRRAQRSPWPILLGACHSLPPRSLRRPRRHPTLGLRLPLSRNTTRSPASPAALQHRLSIAGVAFVASPRAATFLAAI
jgi:hypothetical protein